jgi:hypothetical protein
LTEKVPKFKKKIFLFTQGRQNFCLRDWYVIDARIRIWYNYCTVRMCWQLPLTNWGTTPKQFQQFHGNFWCTVGEVDFWIFWIFNFLQFAIDEKNNSKTKVKRCVSLCLPMRKWVFKK